MIDVSLLNPGNAAYLDVLYQEFLESPDSVSPDWRTYFESVANGSLDTVPRPSTSASGEASASQTEKQVAILQMITLMVDFMFLDHPSGTEYKYDPTYKNWERQTDPKY